MEPFLVLVADQARARLFKSDRRTGPMTEIVGMANPEARLREQDLVSDSPGGSRGASHSMTREGEPHTNKAKLFAKDVSAALERAHETHHPSRIYVMASPNFLGLLRDQWSNGLRGCIAQEFAKDVSTMNSEQIRQYLPELL